MSHQSPRPHSYEPVPEGSLRLDQIVPDQPAPLVDDQPEMVLVGIITSVIVLVLLCAATGAYLYPLLHFTAR